MFRSLFRNILSLLYVAKHLFRKKVTLEYPERKLKTPDKFRGKPCITNCVGCMTCKKVCPTGAIKIEKDSNNKVKSFSFDLKKCIFCGNCAFYCPHKAITMSGEYGLADSNKASLNLVYNMPEGVENE